MKRRQWDSKTKTKIVLEGLAGRSVAEICAAYQINQTQYYKWREVFLENAHQSFETKRQSKREQHLASQNDKLKAMVGELTMELKKNEW